MFRDLSLILLRMETNFRGEGEADARPREASDAQNFHTKNCLFLPSHEPLFIVVKGDIHGIFKNILFPFIVFTLEDLI